MDVVSSTCDELLLSDYQAMSLRFGGGPAKQVETLPPASAAQWEQTSAAPVQSSSVQSDPVLSPAAGDSGGGAAGSASSPAITAQISCGSYIPACWQEAIGFRPPAAMQVRCENGVAFIDLPGTLVWFDDAGRHQETLDNESPVGEKMLGQFHRAVTSLVRNLSGLDDAFRAAEILKSAQQSYREGRRICLGSSAGS